MPNCRRFLILKGLILKGLILCSHGGLESPEAEPEDDEFKFCTLNCASGIPPDPEQALHGPQLPSVLYGAPCSPSLPPSALLLAPSHASP